MTVTFTITPITIDEGIFNPNRLKAAIRPQLLIPTVRAADRDFQSHVAHYSSSPKVEQNVRQFDADVGVSDPFVTMVNVGVPAHTIRAAGGGSSLAFPVNYQAKTTPGVIPSRAGGPSGGLVFAQEVNHPGIEPRRVDIAIQKKEQPVMLQRGLAMIRSLYAV